MPSWEVNFDLRLATGVQNIAEDMAEFNLVE